MSHERTVICCGFLATKGDPLQALELADRLLNSRACLVARFRKERRSVDRIGFVRDDRSVNASIRYISDMAQHGVPGLWSGALATFSRGQGDCEDYAIAKYVILRAAGVPAEDLRIMLVRDLIARELMPS